MDPVSDVMLCSQHSAILTKRIVQLPIASENAKISGDEKK
jgi:hypothetical protein